MAAPPESLSRWNCWRAASTSSCWNQVASRESPHHRRCTLEAWRMHNSTAPSIAIDSAVLVAPPRSGAVDAFPSTTSTSKNGLTFQAVVGPSLARVWSLTTDAPTHFVKQAALPIRRLKRFLRRYRPCYLGSPAPTTTPSNWSASVAPPISDSVTVAGSSPQANSASYCTPMS